MTTPREAGDDRACGSATRTQGPCGSRQVHVKAEVYSGDYCGS